MNKTREIYTESNVVERDGWGAGPWDNEPDIVKFQAFGYDCEARRNRMGAWCGYVSLPLEHDWTKRMVTDWGTEWAAYHFCKLVEYVGEPNLLRQTLKVGFDCAHSWDITPRFADMIIDENASYKDLAFVINKILEIAQKATFHEMGIEDES